MALAFFAPVADAVPIHVVDPTGCEEVLSGLPGPAAAWARVQGFAAALGQSCLLPDDAGRPVAALIGHGTAVDRARQRFAVGAAIAGLPEGDYRLATLPADAGEREQFEIAFGYLAAYYRFDRYKTQSPALARLAPPDGIDASRVERMAAGEALARDLVNTPAEDMGPAALEQAARDLASEMGAEITVTAGTALLEQNLPLIHTVGRASDEAPRLIDMRWGTKGPTLTLVGKGVCFDTGGLNLKPGSSMGLMKKDMGGAANVLGLARMIMAGGTEMRLRVLVPAVENAVAGNAFRPGDILTARNGTTVEINNTDAEGRLVLADALALASETPPDLLVSMATLTGAARVAVGPDIAPFFTDDDGLAGQLAAASGRVADPVWRLPLHAPYEAMIEPGIADLDNAPKGGMAGAITAALFLRRFAASVPRYVHFDIYAWQASAAPGRPVGGLGQGIRTLYHALPEVLTA